MKKLNIAYRDIKSHLLIHLANSNLVKRCCQAVNVKESIRDTISYCCWCLFLCLFFAFFVGLKQKMFHAQIHMSFEWSLYANTTS